MDTDVKIFNCLASESSPETILESGNFFSGSIYFSKEKQRWVTFNLVNKETMKYILSDIKFDGEVMLEIFSYAKNSTEVQQPGDWDSLK